VLPRGDYLLPRDLSLQDVIHPLEPHVLVFIAINVLFVHGRPGVKAGRGRHVIECLLIKSYESTLDLIVQNSVTVFLQVIVGGIHHSLQVDALSA
jgi:hypothetical protein